MVKHCTGVAKVMGPNLHIFTCIYNYVITQFFFLPMRSCYVGNFCSLLFFTLERQLDR